MTCRIFAVIAVLFILFTTSPVAAQVGCFQCTVHMENVAHCEDQFWVMTGATSCDEHNAGTGPPFCRLYDWGKCYGDWLRAETRSDESADTSEARFLTPARMEAAVEKLDEFVRARLSDEDEVTYFRELDDRQAGITDPDIAMLYRYISLLAKSAALTGEDLRPGEIVMVPR